MGMMKERGEKGKREVKAQAFRTNNEQKPDLRIG
jgi:hypothetical protein